MPGDVVSRDTNFPSGMGIPSAVLHMLGTTILAHCLSRRIAQTDLSSWRAIARLTWPRVCMLLVFLDSWLFLFSSGLLVLGIGLESSSNACMSAIFLCIAFYVTSKVFIYFFLIEKIRIVWQPCPGSKRFSSRLFTVCFLTVCLYVIVAALMVSGKIHHLQQDGECIIGLKAFSSILLLSYDLFVNILFTTLFVWPLLRFNFANSFVRSIAVRTLIAAAVALTTSTVNITVLTVLHGSEPGWICLGSCGIDVIVNAMALFYASTASTAPSDKTITFQFPEIHITNLEAAPNTLTHPFTIPTGSGTERSMSPNRETSPHPLTLKSFLDSQRWTPGVQVTISHENSQTTKCLCPNRDLQLSRPET